MTDFIKVLLLLVVLAAVAIVASADPGQVVITWFNLRIETTAVLLVIVLALVTFLSMAVMRLILSLAGVPQHVQHWREKRAWAKNEIAVPQPSVPVTPSLKAKAKTRGQK